MFKLSVMCFSGPGPGWLRVPECEGPAVPTTLDWRIATFMDILDIVTQIKLVMELFITLFTRILDTFMFSLYMCVKFSLLCTLMIALITKVLNSFNQ